MAVSRILSRATRSFCRSSSLLSATQSEQLRHSLVLSNHFHWIVHESRDKLVSTQASLLHHSIFKSSSGSQMSSTASPEPSEKEQGSATPSGGDSSNGESITNGDDSESNDNLSMEDLAKLVVEKEELLKLKQKEIEKMQDKVLRSFADMENIMDRARREAENSKKFSVQNFAKNLLDVADNLGRASSVVKESFSKIDTSKDSSAAVPLLKTLLEGVEMTDKQLLEVLRKFGVEKYDPTNEPFDPHRHNAVFQMPDSSKPPGTVAAVLKAGYMLHDRVLRPAEVGVTQAVENDNGEGSEA